MSTSTLKFYRLLSRLRFLSYGGKIMLVSFIGAHVPLLVLIIALITGVVRDPTLALQIAVITLVATLIGTAAMLWSLHHLLQPVTLTSRALRVYMAEKKLPDLPADLQDAAGSLMADTDYALNRLDDMIEQLEYSDLLTGIANRRRFHHYIGERCEQTPDLAFAVCAIELLDLSDVAGSFGQDRSDQLLRVIIRRLEVALNYKGGLSRVYDTTLAFVLDVHDESDAREHLTELFASLDNIVVGTLSIDARCRAGIAFYEAESVTAEQLLDHALAALRTAMHQSTTSVFYSVENRTELQARYQLESDLRTAVDKQQLFLQFQPVVDVDQGVMIGAEVLLRWQHPQLGMVPPDEFIALAEACGLVERIGRWTLEATCRQLRRWVMLGIAPKRLSVNLSARQFGDPRLLEHVESVINQYDIPGGLLEFELTETAATIDVAHTSAVLKQLRALGIGTAIDDFGTGYSSMSYLSALPFDRLKIDRAFVRDSATNREHLAICRALIALARELDLSVLAEGAETLEEVRALQAHGCSEFQGFYFSRPVDAADFAAVTRSPATLFAETMEAGSA